VCEPPVFSQWRSTRGQSPRHSTERRDLRGRRRTPLGRARRSLDRATADQDWAVERKNDAGPERRSRRRKGRHQGDPVYRSDRERQLKRGCQNAVQHEANQVRADQLMNVIVGFALRFRLLIVVLFGLLLLAGTIAFVQLNIESYPDPVPPLVDIDTQSPGQSAEEIERYITIPIESTVSSVPYLTTMRTISLFGLSD